ncbi:MAG: GTP-binding protein [Candidatus Wukongarchaeota archaeon]|nr:GTP-binding protein [Candidatus Wukongarchaeota archaeon]
MSAVAVKKLSGKKRQEQMNQGRFFVKIALLGDGGVGKSTLLKAFTDQTLNSGYEMTLGIDFAIKKIKVDSQKIILSLWDFGGQKQFWSIAETFLTGTMGIAYVYDVANPLSLFELNKWIEKAREFFILKGQKSPYELLVGTKIDFENKVDEETLRDFMDQFSLKEHMLCSSVLGYNVEEPFMRLLDLIIKGRKDGC